MFTAVGHDHIIQALIGSAGDFGVLVDNVEILGKRTFPVLIAEGVHVLQIAYEVNQTLAVHIHLFTSL